MNKNFYLGQNFQTRSDRASILNMCIHVCVELEKALIHLLRSVVDLDSSPIELESFLINSSAL